MAEQARVPFSTVLPVPVVNRFRQVAISLPDPHTHADPDEDLDSGTVVKNGLKEQKFLKQSSHGKYPIR